jgi:pyridoxamine 5'-phosphate oxidase-like protein
MGADWLTRTKGMSEDELRALLAKPLIARLATTAPDGSPYIIPCWFHFDGTRITTRLRQKSEAMQHILRDPRIALSIADDAPPYPRVQILGRARVLYGPGPIVEPWLSIARENMRSYLGEDAVGYLDETVNRPRYVIEYAPERVISWKATRWASRYL